MHVELRVWHESLNIPAMALVFSSIEQQLPQIRTLVLRLEQSWADARLAWQQLCKITQLTHLSLRFNAGIRQSMSLEDVCLLGKLTNLQQLEVSSMHPKDVAAEPGQELQLPDMSFLGNLTALTQLELPVWTTEGFSSIESCSKLEVLLLRGLQWTGPRVELCEAACEAIGKLTALQELYISRSCSGSTSESFLAALGKLAALQQVTVGVWSHSALPVLAGLEQLHSISGFWMQEPADPSYSDVRCTQVTYLGSATGHIPFTAFPSLLAVEQEGPWRTEVFTAMTQHCSKLRAIRQPPLNSLEALSWASIPSTAPLPVRVATIKSLAGLPDLTQLTYRPLADAECVALVQAAPQLEELQMLIPAGCRVTPYGLQQLAALRNLKELRIGPIGANWGRELPQIVAQALLCAFGHVQLLAIGVSNQAEGTALRAAEQWIAGLGLQNIPQDLTIWMAT